MEMEVSKQASGSIVKSLTYKAVISLKNEKDRAVYDQCVEWRQLEEERNEGVAELGAAATLQRSDTGTNLNSETKSRFSSILGIGAQRAKSYTEVNV